MPVDVRGYKVVYGDKAYKAMTVEPIWDYGEDKPQDGIHKPWRLRVSIIDHESRFAVIDDYYEYFAFVKEVV
jgi:hypothetical protein